MNSIMFVLHNIGNQEEIHAEKKLFFKKITRGLLTVLLCVCRCVYKI